MTGRRLLLVLDDVWYKKGVSEHELQKVVSPLKVGYRGSKILATSRTENALLALGAVRCFRIADMDDDVFLRLFMHYALEGAVIDERDRTVFEEIGSEIAKKLSRSPLAVSTVGGQLRMRPCVEFWIEVCNLDILNETIGALSWSYRHFDEQVRRCFAYCSVFPRRYRLKRYDLINMWVAEGFIKSTDAGEDMEDVAGRYFDELVSTSFLQPAGQRTELVGTVDCFTVHDLLHDLAERVAGTDCFRMEDGWTGALPQNVRHLFVDTYNKMMIFEKISEMENLRTLIIPGDKWDVPIEETEYEIMFMRLRKFRVLNAQALTTYMILFPESICLLKHLRYLAFRTGYRSTQVLPRTFTKLYHLQILDFGRCRDVVFPLGEDMSNLISLRHVITVASLNFPNIGRLKTLPFLTVKKEQGYELHQLHHLNNLRGNLRIHGLENVHSKDEALEAKLVDKYCLTELTLACDEGSCNSSDDEGEVLEGFCPPRQLQKLEIRGYHSSRYPNWMVDKNMNGPKYLHELKLSKCSRLRPAPQLFEYFIHLCSFWLFYCNWDTLPDNIEHLTALKELTISECPNIHTLPVLPQSLLYLRLSHCSYEFTRSCVTIGHPNWQKIQHILEKEIDYNRVLTFDL
uniref:Uncharacterized protein n=1 Tax=Leersia perrieri TaxID=77586 RepID=A0A0D9W2P1_9ORYZ